MTLSHRLRLIAFGLVLFSVTVGVVAYQYFNRPDSSDSKTPSLSETQPENPQVSFASPFRNIRPGVQYFGDSACQSCHREISDSYHQHPMGKSAAWITTGIPVSPAERTAKMSFTSADRREYRVETAGSKPDHVEVFSSQDGKTKLETHVAADLEIGSGHLGKSYLCIRDGSVWQTGISWFTTKQIWNSSPGFTSSGRHGQRAISTGCLICHVDRVEPIPGTINRFREPVVSKQPSIGCERCHGPGELHVSEKMTLKPSVIPDTSIVNPKHLEPALRDAVCQQCHLQGEIRVIKRGRDLTEFRPGIPIELIQTVFTVERSGQQKSVGQVEQLQSSRCATMSQGKLGCISCHDPHGLPTESKRVEHFRKACLSCHADRACSAPQAERQKQSDSCIVCHMSSGGSANIPHASVTDHRILRKPDTTSAEAGKKGLIPFHANSKYQTDAGEMERDRAVAVARRLVDRVPQETTSIADAIPPLRAALKRHPSDSTAWELLSRLRGLSGQWKEAESDIAIALTLAPNDEAMLQWGSVCSFSLGDHKTCLDRAKRAVALNPQNVENSMIVGNALLELGQVENATAEFRAILKIVPSKANARAGLAICLTRMGDSFAGRHMLDLAIELDPDRAKTFREWYLRLAR